MHVLFPTGHLSETTLRSALSYVTEFSYEIASAGEIASFLTPATLKRLIREHPCDMVIVSGMCTADFSTIETETGIPIRRGTRHASDIYRIIPLLLAGKLSKTISADEIIHNDEITNARSKLTQLEETAKEAFTIRGVKLGGTSRIKVIHEIMDAHRHPNLREATIEAIDNGADMVDLGFGFDANVSDVHRCFTDLFDIAIPLSIDTLNPDLIRASLFRADMILSLTAETIPILANDIIKSCAIPVLIPDKATIQDTIEIAKKHGLTRIIVDPLLKPPLSGFVSSLSLYIPDLKYPKLLGCVNVVEMMDADSPGLCALLASVAAETNCACVLISEHSDKTKGATDEMRRACEMMQLSRNRPYPKDVGINVFLIKEKRKRKEPKLSYIEYVDAPQVSDDVIEYDPNGNFRIGIENGYIVAVRHNKAIRGKSWYDVFRAILAEDGVSYLDHAAYLGKELYKAEIALKYARSFEQDGDF